MKILNQEVAVPWKYTDDIIVVLIVLAYIAQPLTGTTAIPDDILMVVLGWLLKSGASAVKK